MAQLNFSAQPAIKPPPHGKIAYGQGGTEIPILALLKESYLLWHSFLPHLPRLTRYTIGVKIDALFLELLEITHTAKYAKREEKIMFLDKISRRLDNLKFFVTLLWEAKGINAGNYGQLAKQLSNIGAMLGGWVKKIQTAVKQAPPA